MSNNHDVLRSTDVFNYFTSREWMQVRRSQKNGLYEHVRDLQRLGGACATDNVEDFARRIVLSYVEYLDRQAFRDVPFEFVETLWLLGADAATDVAPIIEMIPQVETRISFAARYAKLLQMEGRCTDSLLIVEPAVVLFLRSDAAAFQDVHSSQNLCASLAQRLAYCRIVNYSLLARAVSESRQIHSYRENVDDLPGSSITYELVYTVLEPLVAILGSRGESTTAQAMVDFAGEHWISHDQMPAARKTLLCSLAKGLADGGNFNAAELVLDKLDIEDNDVIATWNDLLLSLFDAREEMQFKSIWRRLRGTQVGAKFTSMLAGNFRREVDIRHLGINIYEDSWEPLKLLKPYDSSADELKKWLRLNIGKNLWRNNFAEVERLLATWTELESQNLSLPFGLAIDSPVFRRLQLMSDDAVVNFGSVAQRDSLLFTLLAQEQFELVQKLAASRAANALFGRFYRFGPSAPVPDFSRIAELTDWTVLEGWLSDLNSRLSTSWRSEWAEERAVWIAGVVFRLARLGQTQVAEQIVERFQQSEPQPGYASVAFVWRAIASGITISHSIELGRQYVKEKDLGFNYDLSADLWITARALMTVGRLEEALALVRQGFSSDPGYNNAWLTLAGLFSTRLDAKELAATLALNDLAMVAQIGKSLSIVDPSYALTFLFAALWQVAEPRYWQSPKDLVKQSAADQLLGRTVDAVQSALGNKHSRQAITQVIQTYRFLHDLSWAWVSPASERALIVLHDQEVWIGAQSAKLDNVAASAEQALSLFEAVPALETVGEPSALLDHRQAYLLYTAVYLWVRLGAGKEASSSVLERLITLIPDELDYVAPLLILPAEVARNGDVVQADAVARRLLAAIQAAAGDQKLDGDADVLQAGPQVNLQIALAAPPSEDRARLLRECSGSKLQVELLLQAIAFCGHYDDSEALEVLIGALEGRQEEPHGPDDDTWRFLTRGINDSDY